MLRRIDALAAEYDLQVANVFHAGDGNLHPLVCYDGPARSAARAEELAGRIVERVRRGSAARSPASTGSGSTRRRYMPKMFDESDLRGVPEAALRLRPAGLANPGKVMPTPRLCGEVPGPYREHPLERAGLAERF